MADNDLKYILVVDPGTSGPKSALVSTYGEVVDYEFAETKLILLPNGGAEQNPDDWWRSIGTQSLNERHYLDGLPGQRVYQRHNRRTHRD